MNKNYTIKVLLSSLVLGLVMTPVQARELTAPDETTVLPSDINDNLWGEKQVTKSTSNTSKRLYAGASLMQSQLKPKVLSANGKVTSSSSTGYKVYAGYNINDIFAIEAGYYDFGKASVDTGSVKGDINYKAIGLQAVAKKKITRKATVIGKIGVSSLQNSSTNKLKVKQVNKNAVNFGLGAEYSINKALSVRAEYEMFDKDFQALSIGINASTY